MPVKKKTRRLGEPSGKDKRRVLKKVTIHHFYQPYKIKAFTPYTNLPLCIVRLEKNHARVLHNPTGLTMLNAMNLDIAYEACRSISFAAKKISINKALQNITWQDFKEFTDGHSNNRAKIVCELMKNMDIPGVLTAEEVKGLKFKHKPEYIR